MFNQRSRSLLDLPITVGNCSLLARPLAGTLLQSTSNSQKNDTEHRST